ncbi:MAG: ATP-binding protein [Vicinamibacterales bacterium]
MLLRRVLVAVALAAVSLFATVIGPALQMHAPYLLPMAGVMTAAWYAGLWAGLLTCFVVIVGIAYYLLPPAFSLHVADGDDVVRLAIFVVVSLFMSAIIERGRRTAATLRATLWSIDDAVIVTDRQGRVTFMNPVAERLTGWLLKGAAGRPVAEVYRILDEPSRELISSRIEGMLREGVLRESTILGPRKERLLLSVDGAEHPVVDSGASVVDENGDRLGAVLVFRDVSEQRAARQSAERANRLKDEFLATVSHELRTPLNAVLGWTRMLLTGSIAPGATARAIEAVDRNADALANLVNDLLDVSRIVTGQLRLKPEETDVAQLVRDSLETLGPSLAAKRLGLSAQIDPVPLLVVDPNRMRQVVWNLLSNASKFTPADGQVAVTVGQGDACVQIVVADTGQGIGPDQLPFVFNRFWQADAAPTRMAGGLGLGLAIVRHLVEAHAGTVTVHSEGIGQGATFTVTLPLPAAARIAVLPHAAPSQAAAPAGRRGAPSIAEPTRGGVGTRSGAPARPTGVPSLEGLHVLAVDDEPDSLDLVAEALRRRGAHVRTARSADEAISLCRERMPDVLVADIGMPGQDGFTLLRELHESTNDSLPALALTAYAGESHRRAALDAGFTDQMEKPIDPDQLAVVVGEITRRH